MDLKWYKPHPWGVSRAGMSAIDGVFSSMPTDERINIVEFGSGSSTYALWEMVKHYGLDASFLSFDDSEDYAADMAGVNIRPLLTCSSEDFEEMFRCGIYMPQKMDYYLDRKHSRQRNCFYKIKHNDLKENIGFMLLDGPNGNGRSIAFLHTKDLLHSGSIVFIDDYDHYDFMDRLSLFHEYDVLFKKDKKKDRFIIVKIK